MIVKGKEAQEKLLEGINETVDVVKTTLGSKGKTVLIQDKYGLGFNVTKDGVTVAEATTFDEDYLNIGSEFVKHAAKKTVDEAGDGPQPLYSKVLTPNGWVEMGTLKVGDIICGTNGSFQKVLEIHDKGNREIYKLKFSNGQEVECCENHYWNISRPNGVIETLTLKEIIGRGIKTLKNNGYYNYNTYIPTTLVDFNVKNDFIIDPLLVGLLIGDGSLCKSGSVELSLAIGQEWIMNDVILPEGIIYNIKIDNIKNYVRIKFKRKNKFGKTMHDYVEEIGLLDIKSKDKYIPKEYLYSNLSNRLRLLKGLTITDGHINKRGLLEYSTVSRKLSDDVTELLRGLGKQVYVKEYIRKKDSSYSNNSKSIFRIYELKGYKNGIKLVDVVKTGEITPMMCIKVSNPDHLYITNDYVLTHNTTTTSILTQSMCNNVFKEIELGKNQNKLINDLKEDLNTVVNYIKDNSKKIENTEDIKNIAIISSNNDTEISNIIKDIYDKTNFDVVIDVVETDDTVTSYEIVKGFTIHDTGYSSRQFINNFDKGRVEYSNPRVYINNGKIKSITPELFELLGMQQDKNSENFRPLVLIVEDIEEMALREIVSAYGAGALSDLVVVQSNLIFNDRKNSFLDASIFLGNDYSENKFSNEGECEKIVIEKDRVTFINGKGSNIEKHIEKLKEEYKENNKVSLKNRIFALESNAAIIKVGGKLITEISEKKDRVDDAVSAVKSAIEEGYLPGGSSTLLFAKKDLSLKTDIMSESLLSCYKQLMINAGLEPFFYLKDIYNEGFGFGFNLNNELVSNMYEDGIYDSTKVLRVSLENAVHTACTFALINSLIIK